MPLAAVEGSRIPSGCLDLHQNFPVEVPQIEHAAWRDAMARLRRRVDLSRLARQCWSEVSRRSQQSGQAWMRRLGVSPPLRGVSECRGTQSALVALVNAAMTPGDVLLAPALSHPGIRLIAEQHGLKLHGLPMDDQGITTDAFDEAYEELPPKMHYLSPTLHSTPTITMPEERRRAIAEIAVRHNVVILEDESAAFLLDDPPTPITTLAPEHTFFVADFWMAFSLGLAEAILLAVPGLLIGGVLAFGIAFAMQSELFGVSPTDPVSFGIAVGLLVVVVLLASVIPARKASGIEPIDALRCE